MSDLQPQYPLGLDVFIPLIDGFSPIEAGDINLQLAAIERIQQALGYGEARSNYGTFGAWGPKGTAADVAARLDGLLEPNGGMKDVAFVTGSSQAGGFAPSTGGLYIPFGKRITGATMGPGGYVVVFGFLQEDASKAGPAYPYVADKTEYGCWIKARSWDGQALFASTSDSVKWSLLAFGASVPAI